MINMFDVQDSDSHLNIFIHMDDTDDSSSLDSCTSYAVPGIFTFNSDTLQTSTTHATEMAEPFKDTNANENNFLQPSRGDENSKHLDTDQDVLLSPGAKLYEGTEFIPKDNKIFEAVNEALNSGSLTPLIKEELKYSIQSRRLKEGKRELAVDFEEPKQYQLSEEEVVKVENRRVQNRVAAQRFRERQKLRAEELQKKCNRIEANNTQLRYELKKLREEKEKVRKELEDHLKICPFMSRGGPYVPR